MSKNFVDINNLNRFWTKAKEYVDNEISNNSGSKTIIPEYSHDGTYSLKSNNHYILGTESYLNLYLSQNYDENAPKFSFQFRSGAIPTEISISYFNSSNGLLEWTDPMNEPYCEYYVEVLGNVAHVRKRYYEHYLMFEAIDDSIFNYAQNGNGQVQYSLNNGYDWINISSGNTVSISAGDVVMWRGNLVKAGQQYNNLCSFKSSGRYKVSGNIMSLLFKDDFLYKNDLTGYSYAFSNMFSLGKNSTSATEETLRLMDASNLELPATTLSQGCYGSLFCGSSIKRSPILPAETLAAQCYMRMFQSCPNINEITMLATNISASQCLQNWVTDVPSIGTFYKAASMTSLPTGNSGIPTGWNVEDYVDPNFTEKPYLTTTLLTSGKMSFLRYVSKDVEYSIDGGRAWAKLDCDATSIEDYATSVVYTPEYPAGTKIMWRASIDESRLQANGYGGMGVDATGFFVTTGDYSVSGYITSLIRKDDFETNNKAEVNDIELISPFYGMFGYYNMVVNGGTPDGDPWPELINASELILPSKLTPMCYQLMFYICARLTTAPELPYTELTDSCYYNMFTYCTSLTTAPTLPATTLTEGCYDCMFQSCASLTEAPDLPATTLAKECYKSMFYGCTSLITAPTLPATTLAEGCYDSMFENCTSLTKAPDLPAITLAEDCYYYMFNECSNLNNITMLATDISANRCLSNWVKGVASSGTFTKAPSMTSLPIGTNGIPSGWTVKNIDGSPVTSPDVSVSISWAAQTGNWTEGSNSSAKDGKQFTSVSPGSNGSTRLRCTFSGVTSITFNCVYKGESNYDYLTVGKLDSTCTRDSYGTTLKGTSGTAKDITFSCDSGTHYVEFCYSKDVSVDTSPDCAVVYVKNYSK